ncbi:ABC transporter permease [Cellulomonas citrea]|uniref:ABC transporter permease n=1 Tax=Cellulomonas citrea TaxID=1909423 RepID=UPI00135CDAF1|nr:ABC transporter permease [Cellulomonas citrea]
MRLAASIGRRLVATATLLLALSFLVFSLLYLAPGDVARNLLGARPASPESLAAIREKFGLDQPFLTQYWHWLSGALTGDLGESVRSGSQVTDVLGQRVGLTLQLTVLAFVIALGVGAPAGIRAARRHGSVQDKTIVSLAVVGVAAPGFAVGLVLLYVFAVMLGWFPVYGTGDTPLDRLWHLALPAVALAAGLAALVVKVTRTAVLRELESDYVTFARARGLTPRAVARLYLTNAAIPVLTSAGLLLAFLFGGTILVETTFSLPGLGSLLAESITFKDIPVVQAVTLVVAVVISLAALAVDLLTLAVDPRVRRAGLT